MAYGLAIAGHLIIALILLLGFFERTEPAPVAAMPVEIVMEETAAASPPPVSAPNERSSLPSVPTVADADKHAKAQLATVDVNGVNRPKQPGHDGGDPSSGPNETPMPRAAGDLASGVSLPSWAVEPIGLAQRQATARESGQDELTAIAEPELKVRCESEGAVTAGGDPRTSGGDWNCNPGSGPSLGPIDPGHDGQTPKSELPREHGGGHRNMGGPDRSGASCWGHC